MDVTNDIKQTATLNQKLAQKEKEIKQLEEELNKAKEALDVANKTKFIEPMESLQNIVSVIPGNVYWKNRAGVYQGCSDEMAKMSKLSDRNAIRGKTIYDLAPPEMYDVAKKVAEEDDEIMRLNEKRFFEEEGWDANGNLVIYLTRKAPLYDETNKVIGMIGVSVDINERKKYEKELQEAKLFAEATLKAKEIAETESYEKSIILKNVLKEMKQKRYYLTGKLTGIYLTLREAQTIICLARGYSAKEMAKALQLSSRTIETHLNNIKKKLRCSARSELITKAIECHFLDGIKPLVDITSHKKRM